jgi:hypothetical protein
MQPQFPQTPTPVSYYLYESYPRLPARPADAWNNERIWPQAQADTGALRPAWTPPEVSFPTALWSAVISGANELGRNLHGVRRGEVTVAEALARSLLRGAATSLATTTATALTADLADRHVIRLAALAATTTALSYLISGLPNKPR